MQTRALVLASFPLLLGLLALAACSSSSSGNAASGAPDAGEASVGLGGYDPVPFGGSRPVKLYVPSGYKGEPTPLLIMLHGYSASGGEEELLLNLKPIAEAKTVLYAYPDGTIDPSGNRFWNATDACCDFWHSNVDDVAYLTSLVKEIGTRYNVDPKRVYFLGHSNGAFMSYRMACDQAGMVAAVVSIAGAMWLDPSKCKPSAPVSVLEVHGTADVEIDYDGGTTAVPEGGHPGGGQYPAVATTVADWVGFDGCASPPDTSLPPIGIDAMHTTNVTRYSTACHAPSEVDLWTMDGEGHIPAFTSSFGPMALDFLLSHGR